MKEATKVNIGDVVHVRAEVTKTRNMDARDGFGVLTLKIDGGSVESYVSSVVHVETRPLQVGDVVQIGNGWGSERYELRAIVDDQAMLRKRVAYTSDDYEYVVRALSQLERI